MEDVISCLIIVMEMMYWDTCLLTWLIWFQYLRWVYVVCSNWFFLFQSEVFAVAFAILVAGAVILTLNMLLLVSPSCTLHSLSHSYLFHTCIDVHDILDEVVVYVQFFQGGQIIFFQSLSLLSYCLFPLDVGALICLLKDNVILKVIVVSATPAWSSWGAYPFMSSAVNPRRKALALYPVFLMYVSVGFLIIAIN